MSGGAANAIAAPPRNTVIEHHHFHHAASLIGAGKNSTQIRAFKVQEGNPVISTKVTGGGDLKDDDLNAMARRGHANMGEVQDANFGGVDYRFTWRNPLPNNANATLIITKKAA
jgi:hypothetical protein